jgi:hypothetical protein
MKDGVYINLNKDHANLVIFIDGAFEDGDAVGLMDYDVTPSFIAPDIIKLAFDSLEYLGEL